MPTRHRRRCSKRHFFPLIHLKYHLILIIFGSQIAHNVIVQICKMVANFRVWIVPKRWPIAPELIMLKAEAPLIVADGRRWRWRPAWKLISSEIEELSGRVMNGWIIFTLHKPLPYHHHTIPYHTSTWTRKYPTLNTIPDILWNILRGFILIFHRIWIWKIGNDWKRF